MPKLANFAKSKGQKILHVFPVLSLSFPSFQKSTAVLSISQKNENISGELQMYSGTLTCLILLGYK